MSMRWCCLGFLLLAGCGEVSISNQPLSGKIGGNPWTFGTGETMSSFSTTDRLYVDLYPGSFATCAFAAPLDADLVSLLMPNKPGSYDLSLQQNVTLYVASSSRNYVATDGRLQVDSVTATTISGGMHATYDGSNEVDGQFQAIICP